MNNLKLANCFEMLSELMFKTCWLFKLSLISEELPLKLEFIKFRHACKFDRQVFSSNESLVNKGDSVEFLWLCLMYVL